MEISLLSVLRRMLETRVLKQIRRTKTAGLCHDVKASEGSRTVMSGEGLCLDAVGLTVDAIEGNTGVSAEHPDGSRDVGEKRKRVGVVVTDQVEHGSMD